jgi:acetyl esterase/lipase
MNESPSPIHPELRRAVRFMPRFSMTPLTLFVMRTLMRRMRPSRLPPGVTVEDVKVPGPPGAPEVRVRLYRPATLARPAPALLWIHGGGLIIGSPEQDELGSARYAQELGITVAAVQYRLAPEHPFPAALEDCYAALGWLHAHAERLGIHPGRIAVGGASAGGGLAAALAQLAHDRAQVTPAFQLLIYPMLDDRSALGTGPDGKSQRHHVWNRESNRFGWSSYLQRALGAADVPPYAIPARREDLKGLPPAWVGVGTLDLFQEEDMAYTQRLKDCGVECELEVVPGAYHGFDMLVPHAEVTRHFRARQVEVLRRALFPGAATGPAR